MKPFIFLLLLSTTILNAQRTIWNQDKLIQYWKTNGIDEIEGIYEGISESSRSPKYKTALVKSTVGYSLIYLSGADDDTKISWRTGDIKAFLSPTDTNNVFRASWYMGDKTKSEELFIIFNGEKMKIKWTNWRTDKDYFKIYPQIYDDIKVINSPIKHSSGSGFAISSNGIIVTNHHVISNAKKIYVRGINSDFDLLYTAKIILSDNNNDLALIQIDDNNFKSIGKIPYRIKSKLSEVGEDVFVLGYPLRSTMGNEIKLTNGIVSSQTGFQGSINSYQISAPIQPGNSGGPLFDKQGNIIGIINAQHAGAQNASYAIKSNYLSNLIELLPNNLNLPTMNLLSEKTLVQQVEIVKNFIYIIETEQ
jgi:S1-C subfamily serine protease